jgi:tyrosine-protein phosphatase SIW14
MSFLSRISLFLLGLPILASSSVSGVGNFYQVDEHVYRGAQPTPEGFQYLASIGVKTVLDLREADGRSREERRLVTVAGMHYVNVPMTGLTPPSEEQITNILALLEDSAVGPVFVHCKRGADRTGAVIAAYRINHDHWNNQRALTEAMACKMSFVQLPRQNFIKRFQPRTIHAGAYGDSAVKVPTEITVFNPHTAVLQPAHVLKP